MIKNVEVAIEVSSGKLVVDNDLRRLFPEAKDDQNLDGQSTAFWVKGNVENYGKAGLFHGFVGNSCPGIHKRGDVLYIGNQPWDKDDYWPEDTPYAEYPQIPGEQVASICTDLWWYSICDYDNFIRRGGKMDRWGPDIVKVKPGRYILSHHWPFTNIKDSHRPQRMIYATIKRSYRHLEVWRLPEEELFMELKRILSEVKYVWVKSNMGRSLFELFVVVDNKSGHYSWWLTTNQDITLQSSRFPLS